MTINISRIDISFKQQLVDIGFIMTQDHPELLTELGLTNETAQEWFEEYYDALSHFLKPSRTLLVSAASAFHLRVAPPSTNKYERRDEAQRQAEKTVDDYHRMLLTNDLGAHPEKYPEFTL